MPPASQPAAVAAVAAESEAADAAAPAAFCSTPATGHTRGHTQREESVRKGTENAPGTGSLEVSTRQTYLVIKRSIANSNSITSEVAVGGRGATCGGLIVM